MIDFLNPRQQSVSVPAPIFTIAALGEAELRLAWPLARMAEPGAGLEQWLAYVEEIRQQNGDVVGAIFDGGPLGIAAWRVERALAGPVLRVDPLVTVEIQRHAPVRQALLDWLTVKAGTLGCRALRIYLPEAREDQEDGTRGWWRQQGAAESLALKIEGRPAGRA